jgi:hypothetical protein
VSAALIAPTGRNVIAQGNALGLCGLEIIALKGRNTDRRGPERLPHLDHVAPLQGLKIVLWPGPRALPWAITLRPCGADSKNPPHAIPSPRRQLGSEQYSHCGEKVRVRGNPSLAARFELPKVALCQHQNHQSQTVSILLAPQKTPHTVPSPRQTIPIESKTSRGERVRVRGNPSLAGRFELPKVALCQ